MIVGLFKALAQLNDPRLRRVLWASLGWAFVLHAALYAVLGFALQHLPTTDLAWLDTLLRVVSGLGAFLASLWLFPAVVSVILGFYLEQVVATVENRHYPNLPRPRAQPVVESVATALRFAAVAVGLNILFLPLYLIPVINVGAFLLLNGYLLGREYFELVAARRLEPLAMHQTRLRHRGRFLLLGIAAAALLLVPLVNLVAPIVAAAWMVHLLESLRWRDERL
ncbi:MAG: EI24 domain-containing protein [Rhodospirillales bacterium]|nr:EI24 domain-containing protein [Rhodospirillales bacterium]